MALSGVSIAVALAALSVAGLNSYRPGAPPPDAPPSITHRSPAASNTTPCGATNAELLMALVGALPDMPMVLRTPGANSRTLLPLATHKETSITWGLGAVMVELSLQAHARSANPIK